MALIKITSKRQATFPAEVCEELGVASGDSIEILPVQHQNQKVWVLKPVAKARPKWIGSLSKYGHKGKQPWTREQHGTATMKAMLRDSK